MNSLDIELFSRFLGLYIMGLEIPEDLYLYVQSHECPCKDVDKKMIFTLILGSPDSKDSILRSLIIPLI